ncbi:hypothetical protein D3C75_638750 [compost metagenome]
MFRRGATATTDDIQEPGLRPFANLFCHFSGIQIVFTESIRQPGVRVRGNVTFGNARKFCHVLAQFIWPQCAVQAESQRVRVAQ